MRETLVGKDLTADGQPADQRGAAKGRPAPAAALPLAKIDRFFVGLALKRAQHQLRLAINAELASLKTNISHVNVLREIKTNPGVSSVQLATLTFLTPQSLGQLATQLQNQGLVERQPGPNRTLLHYMTESGERLYQEAMNSIRPIDEKVFEVFSDKELTSLLDTLLTIEKRAADLRDRTRSTSLTPVSSKGA